MNIYKTLALFFSFAAVCACGLDYSESSVYSKEDMFKMRTKGVDRMVWGIYAQVNPDDGENWSCGAMLSSACDESVCPWTESTVNNFHNGNWSAANPNSNDWANYYSAIRQANLFLAEASSLTFDEYKDNKDYNDYMKKYSRYKYEVRFLRAYFYFCLAREYGDVPLVLDVLQKDEAQRLVRTPVAKVFEFICDECDEIAPNLPTDWSKEPFQETGRVTAQTALALKARTLLYAASPLFNSFSDPTLWAKAADAALTAIDAAKNAGATIGTYKGLWESENYRNPEILFSVRQAESNKFERYNLPCGVEGGGSANCPTQNLVDAYELKTTGKTWDKSGDAYDPSDPYKDLDPRFNMTVAANGDLWPTFNATPLQLWYGGLNAMPSPGASTTGYYLKKYCDGTIDLRPNSINSKRHAFIVFRLGELYLNYAEAVFNALGGANLSSQRFPMSANDAVNVLRTRSDVDMPTFEGNDGFMERYIRERMVELSFEGHRFWDVRRWMLAQKYFTEIKSMEVAIDEEGNPVYRRVSKPRKWEDKMYFFPIPSAEIAKNPSLMQNEAW